MPSTIEQTKQAILRHGGKASKHQISRELKISLDYAGLICAELKRKGEVGFSDGFYSLISIKKTAIPDKEQKKPAIPPERLKGSQKAKRPRAKKTLPHPLVSALGISEPLARTLEKAGYGTVESISEAAVAKLMAEAKLELRTAAKLINQARGIK